MRPRVLLADDESSVRLALRKIIEEQGCDVTPVPDGQAALDALRRGGYQLVVTDLRMPHADGMQVVRAAMESDPPIKVVVLTGYGTVQLAVEAMRLGAATFLTKPFEISDVESVVREALSLGPRRREPEGGRRDGPRPAESSHALALIGGSQLIARVRALVDQIADSEATVLLGGESGTGKEVVAHLIHERSGRHSGPFIPVNCAAIPEPLLESELFGHARGSFTGATHARTGRFTLAAGGVLFLDEIGDMPMPLQAKVLRVLQDKEVTPVGATHASRIDARIIAATNQDLRALIAQGRFREDLYYRLNVIPITLPPLRDRREDIPLLCEHFLARAAARRGRPPLPLGEALSPEAVARLQQLPWPGNVRELENVIERVYTLRHEGTVLQAEHLPQLLGPTMSAPQRESRPMRSMITSGPLHPPRPDVLPGLSSPSAKISQVSLPEGGMDLREELTNLERRMIETALRRAHGNKQEAARMLCLNRTTLIEKLRRMRLTRPDDPHEPDDEPEGGG